MTLPPYDTPKEIRFARWMARGLSLLLAAFVLILLVFNEDFRTNLNLPTLIFLALTLSTLIAWRWERAGGLLTLLLSPLFLLAVALQWSRTEGIITPTWQLALIGISMTIPFLIIGGLFLYIGKQSQGESDILKKELLNENDRPYLAYVIVGSLGLLAFFSLANSFFTPVQQQMEFPESRHFPDENFETDRSGVGAGQESATAVKPTSIPDSPTQVPPQGVTGISQVDDVIDTILSNDLEARRDLVRFVTLGCTTAEGLGSVPKCEVGQAEGTPVDFLPLGGLGEGGSVLTEGVDKTLDFEAAELYAAYIVAENLPDQPDFPRGTYVLYFSTTGGAESIILRIDMDGRIVRLDNLGRFPIADHFQQKAADLIDLPLENEIFSSEAADILVYPPEMRSPVGG